jgi:hypothetical protein|tara:strand:- start:978 stop:1757 length:780 start_codon:yes stop_codon:yes gene_type:complete
MKLGIAYNLFDGEELLVDSIKSIRNSVDYIIVIYQQVSNFGSVSEINLSDYLTGLKNDGLIDDMVLYNPRVGSGGHFNEITKRNLGLYECSRKGCTHFLLMDSDEFYTEEQFNISKEVILSGDFDSSACQMVTYYKNGSYRLEPKEEYYVPFIYKITPGVEFVLNNPFPVLIDPTRRMGPGKCKIFTRYELEMHHMSFVRKDLNIKLQNSSAKGSFEHSINKIVDYYNNWKYPSPVMWADSRLISVVPTENLFNINFGQ